MQRINTKKLPIVKQQNVINLELLSKRKIPWTLNVLSWNEKKNISR